MGCDTKIKCHFVSQLNKVCFSASRPTHLIMIISHLPEGRPETISHAYRFLFRYHLALGIVDTTVEGDIDLTIMQVLGCLA